MTFMCNKAYFNLFMAVLLMFFAETVTAVTYTRTDSLTAVRLLQEGRVAVAKKAHLNLMIFYGHKLKGVPYVARTLEVHKTEDLVVNLRELDCTTFVENVFALALTTSAGSTSWEDYCKNLQAIRYRDGNIAGYASRNHYFLWWAENNEKKHLVSILLNKMKNNSLLAKQKIYINYMSTHADSYPMFKHNPNDITVIGDMERASAGRIMMYIPQKNLGLSKNKLNMVKDGDILAICTRKHGLDTTHIGIAEWGSDGKLHLLNASQIHKKVVLESMTLKKYMSKHPTQTGVWVIRPLSLIGNL